MDEIVAKLMCLLCSQVDDDVEWSNIKRHAVDIITKFLESGEAVTTGVTHPENSKRAALVL